MTLRRQLLLVSLLTLILPWAGCQFIRETESALRDGQRNFLAGTAQAIADSLSQFPDEFLRAAADAPQGGNQLYGHPLQGEPLVDGYFDDWTLAGESLRTLPGTAGDIRHALGMHRQSLYLFVAVPDAEVVYHDPAAGGRAYADGTTLVSYGAAAGLVEFRFHSEAPGPLVAQRIENGRATEETRITAHWQDTATGYNLEARIPRSLLGERLGLVVDDTGDPRMPGVRSATYGTELPGRLVTPSPVLSSFLQAYAQPGLRLIVTDPDGWRLAVAGSTSRPAGDAPAVSSRLLRLAYGSILEEGASGELAAPDPSGREQQGYIVEALRGRATTSWFRSPETGRAVIAVAQPVWYYTTQTGAVVLQQGTDAILSLTNRALTRLMNFTLIATLVVAGALLGYASWLSFRIRRLSNATERALDGDTVRSALPSAGAADEIGDLSRSFSSVLRQLGEYNDYLRKLAARLSHELRTPLAIVTSSLENLEHEALPEEAARYTARARDGVSRLKKILNAMSEANRVEELIQNVQMTTFDLEDVLKAAVAAYGDAWPERRFEFESAEGDFTCRGAPELIVQMLDKLADNAVDFSARGDAIGISLAREARELLLAVSNPGPPLPESMRPQLFDSLISVRRRGGDEHLGLGLYIARLIAEGHGGSIRARNTDSGVVFEVRLPA